MGCRLLNLRLGSDLRASARAVLPVFVVAALAGDALLSAPEALADLLTVAVLFTWTALLLRPPTTRSAGSATDKKASPGGGYMLPATLCAIAVVSGVAIRIVNGPAEVVALALFAAGADRLLERFGRPDERLPAASLTLLLLAVYLLLEQHLGYLHPLWSLVARGTSSLVSLLVPGVVSIGAGFLGIRLVVLALLYILSTTVTGESARRLKAAAFAGGAVLVMSLAYAAAWGWLSNIAQVQGAAGLLQPFIAPYDFRLLLLTMLVAPLVFLQAAAPPPATVHTAPAGSRWMVATAAFLAVGTILLAAQVGTSEPGGRVVVLDTTGRLAEDLPVYGRYGLGNLGQFGMLPRYLAATGHDTEIVDSVSSATLEDADTLVVLNLREKLDDAGRQAVWEFVEAGGGLLVAGDHTGAEEIRDPSNHLLEPVGISLNFDSAIPLRDRWASGFEMLSHPVFRGITEDEVQVVIGASLTVSPPASPVLLGRAGYSDAGDISNIEQGFLGDMTYTPGEHMGDLVLAADAAYGRGRVLVFGDTTLLQNLAISRSYRFLDNIFGWLGSAYDASAQRAQTLGGAALLVLGALLLIISASRGMSRVPLPALALALALLVSNVALSPPTPTWESRPFADRHAVIDVSHHELGRLDRSGDSLDGLAANLERAGLHPFFMRTFSAEMIESAEVVVLPAPVSPFSRTEIAELDEFMRSGGLLIMTTGSEKPSGSFTLLQHLGYELGGAPMGRAAAAWSGGQISFWSAWPLKQAPGGASQTVAEVWDAPVILYQPRGAGGSIVIADAAFLFEKNLESLDRHDIDNIEFLREILETYPGAGEDDG
ncbi:MAG: hypothetical protein JW733_08015 [Coriobacteriia bacterium]|nr:hypothetical protein [Coriobacteriia bacterium]MBN2840820.1 hypothetical protein [Coriobacteriia bacterium]